MFEIKYILNNFENFKCECVKCVNSQKIGLKFFLDSQVN